MKKFLLIGLLCLMSVFANDLPNRAVTKVDYMATKNLVVKSSDGLKLMYVEKSLGLTNKHTLGYDSTEEFVTVLVKVNETNEVWINIYHKHPIENPASVFYEGTMPKKIDSSRIVQPPISVVK